MTIAPVLAAPADSDPAQRGRLDIDEAVVRKIVEHATDQVPGTLREPRRLAGVSLGDSGSSAKVWVGDEFVDARLTLAVRYPAPVAGLVAEVRAKVAEAIGQMAGLRLRQFDVTISGLYRESPSKLV